MPPLRCSSGDLIAGMLGSGSIFEDAEEEANACDLLEAHREEMRRKPSAPTRFTVGVTPAPTTPALAARSPAEGSDRSRRKGRRKDLPSMRSLRRGLGSSEMIQSGGEETGGGPPLPASLRGAGASPFAMKGAKYVQGDQDLVLGSKEKEPAVAPTRPKAPARAASFAAAAGEGPSRHMRMQKAGSFRAARTPGGTADGMILAARTRFGGGEADKQPGAPSGELPAAPSPAQRASVAASPGGRTSGAPAGWRRKTRSVEALDRSGAAERRPQPAATSEAAQDAPDKVGLAAGSPALADASGSEGVKPQPPPRASAPPSASALPGGWEARRPPKLALTPSESQVLLQGGAGAQSSRVKTAGSAAAATRADDPAIDRVFEATRKSARSNRRQLMVRRRVGRPGSSSQWSRPGKQRLSAPAAF